MSRKIVIACIVVFSLWFCVTPAECLADAAELLQQAQTCKNSGNHQLAEQTYNAVVADYPGTDYALTAKGEIITIMSIPAKTDSQIQAEVDSLKAEFSALPGLPAVLCNIAAGYAWAGKYQQAGDLYQQIIQDYPASSAIAKAQIGALRANTLNLIQAGNYAAAAVEVNNLVNSYSSSKYLPATLYHIARNYQWVRQYEQAASIHQEIIQRFPDSSEADRARLDVGRIKVLSLIKSGDYTAAEAQSAELLQQLSGHPGLPVVLHSIAREYERKAKYAEAAALHQQVIQQYPDNARAERARFDYPRTNILYLIQAADFTTAESRLDSFKADFNSNANFTKAMFNIGEEYYKSAVFTDPNAPQAQADGLYAKAVSAWQTVLQDSESYSFTPIACYLAGRCFYRLGDYENAITCCQRAAADWPDYDHACDSLLVAGRSTEKLLDAGEISKSQAGQQITAAYTQIVEKYPACEAGRYAQRWLARNNAE